MARLDLKIRRTRDLREDGDFQIKQINRMRKELEDQLTEEVLKEAPKILHCHLTEEGMLEDLLKHGKCSRTISHNVHDGLETRQKIKTAFKEFQKIAGPLLEVSFNNEKHRTEVVLEVVK